jgi:hypothetical protein
MYKTFEVGRDLRDCYSCPQLEGFMQEMFGEHGIRLHEVRPGRNTASFTLDGADFSGGIPKPEGVIRTADGSWIMPVEHTLHIVVTGPRGPVTVDDLGSRVLAAARTLSEEMSHMLVAANPSGTYRMALVQEMP